MVMITDIRLMKKLIKQSGMVLLMMGILVGLIIPNFIGALVVPTDAKDYTIRRGDVQYVKYDLKFVRPVGDARERKIIADAENFSKNLLK